MKKVLTLILAFSMLLSLTACKGSEDKKTTDATASFESIVVGEDSTDLTATVRILTHRTDLIDNGGFDDYVAEFNKLYPNITIEYEGITDYAETMTTRLTDTDWGDVCMIPSTVEKKYLSDYFVALGSYDTISAKYQYIDKTFDGVVYGMPSTNNVQGIVFNRAVFADAGITTLPTTPTEFIADLQLIKDNTDAIPLYTNYAAGWTLGAWDSYIGGCATGDAAYKNQILPHASDPFADQGDETGPYAVYSVLYDAVAQGLIEEDPMSTDWESCKAMINNGEIGVMVLGSWAVSQMQAAGDNAADIGYMPFPITVDGTQNATVAADYNYGVNKYSDADTQLASMIYIKWLTEDSGFAYNEGGVPVVIGDEYPATLTDFADVNLIVDELPLDGEESLLGDISTASEVAIDNNNARVQAIVDAAYSGSATLDEIVATWNDAWTAAQEEYGA